MDFMAKFWLIPMSWWLLKSVLSSPCHGLSLGVPLWTHITRGTSCGVMLTFVHLFTPLMPAWNPVPPVQVAVSGPVFCQG